MLGPLLYSLYTSPLGDKARKHGIPFHLFAVDTPIYIYVSFTSNCPNHTSYAKETVEVCVKDIGDWMLCNKFKLNKEKTKPLVVSQDIDHVLPSTTSKSEMMLSIPVNMLII